MPLLNSTPNKNAFQWNVYHLLVDCIPACTGQRGVSARGGGGVSAKGVSAQGGVYSGGVWRVSGADNPPPVDRQTPVKT